MSLGIPVMAVPGRGMNFPISLSYAAGIKVNQESSWTGLGFDFIPGAITRTVNGIPDDYNNNPDYNSKDNIGFFLKKEDNAGSWSDFQSAADNAKTISIVRSYDLVCSTSACGIVEATPVDEDVPAGQARDSIANLGEAGSLMMENSVCESTKRLNGFIYYTESDNILSQDSSICNDPTDENSVFEIDRLNPDSFRIIGPVSGSMMFSNNKDKKFHLTSLSGEYNKVDDPIKIEYKTANDGSIISFTITTQDGTKYIYDYPIYNVNKNGLDGSSDKRGEYTTRGGTRTLFDYVSSSVVTGEDGYKFGRYFLKKYAYTWLLTAILASDYQDSNNNGIPDKEDKGNWIKFNYNLVYGKNSLPFEYRTPFNGYNEYQYGGNPYNNIVERGIESCPQYPGMYSGGGTHCTESITHGYMEVAYPESIETPTHKAVFVTSNRDDAAEYTETNPTHRNDRFLKKLDEMRLTRNNNLISKVKLDYDYSLNKNIPANKNTGINNEKSGRLTLKKVQQFDKNNNLLPATTFSYVDNNPDWDTRLKGMDDQFHKKQGTNEYVYYTTDYHSDTFGYYWENGDYLNHKIADGYIGKDARSTLDSGYPLGYRKVMFSPYNDMADSWSLNKVCWPSGSCTKYEYEIDKYDWIGEKETIPTGGIDGNADGSGGNEKSKRHVTHYGGGIRVKKITQEDQMGKYIYGINYEYGDGVLSYPDINLRSLFNPNFVGYKQVNVSIPGYGKTAYEFTTAKDYPPVEIDLKKYKWSKEYVPGDLWRFNYEDTSPLWGLEKEITTYGEQDNIIAKTTNTYDIKNAKQKDISWKDECNQANNCYSNQDLGRSETLSPYWVKLTNSESMLDGVQKTIEYKYNGINGLPSETIESGNNIKKITTTNYAFENGYSGMLDKHILTKPYETKLLDENNNLISKSITEYFAPGIFNLYNKEFFYYPVKSASVWKNTDNKWLKTTFDKYDEYGNLLETTDSKGYKTYFEYSPIYDYAYLTRGENALGQFMLTDYDPEFGVVKSITDFNGQTTYYDYDNFGRLIKVIKDGKALNKYEYDDKSFDWRKTATKIDVLKEMKLTEYFDDFARLDKTELIGPVGNIVTRTDYNSYLIDKVSKIYKPDYNKASSLFIFSEYEFSPLARIVKVDPPGDGDIKTEYSKKEGMYKTTVIDEELRAKSSLTDAFGNLRKVIENDVDINRNDLFLKITCSDIKFTDWIKDNNIITDEDPTKYCSVDNPNAKNCGFAECDNGYTFVNCENKYEYETDQGYCYYRAECKKTYTSSCEKNAKCPQDLGNFPVKEEVCKCKDNVLNKNSQNAADYESTGITFEEYSNKIYNENAIETKYNYDLQNNLLTITDSKGRKITDNKYNSLGQLTESWQADTGTTKFVYDDNGNMIERNQNGTITTYSYDKLNRLIKITYPTTAVVNIYDSNCLNNAYAIGKLCQIQDTSGMIQFEYDSWGRVVKEIKNVNSLGVNKKYTINYTYNDINDITEINLFNDNNELINKIDYQYNNLNQLEKVKVNDKEITYSYNPTSTIKEISFGNNKKTSYDYTERDWIKGIDTGNIFNRGYSYDKIGNLKELKKNNVLLATFSYDNLDRLTFVDDNDYYGKDIGYFYDSVGNRRMRYEGINLDVSALAKATNEESEASARLIASSYAEYQYSGVDAASATNNQMTSDSMNTYTYDINGNMLSKKSIADGATTIYDYDEENRLIKVTLPDGKVNEDVYDANGLRTIKKDSAGTTIYIYDMNGNNIYEETI